MTGLLVFWDQKIVGTLTRHKSGKVVFQYDKDWMASDGRSISISLPCQQEKFAKTMNFRFIFLNEIIEETLTAVGSQLGPLLGEHEKQYGKSIVYDELYEKIQKNMRSMKKIQESRRISG